MTTTTSASRPSAGQTMFDTNPAHRLAGAAVIMQFTRAIHRLNRRLRSNKGSPADRRRRFRQAQPRARFHRNGLICLLYLYGHNTTAALKRHDNPKVWSTLGSMFHLFATDADRANGFDCEHLAPCLGLSAPLAAPTQTLRLAQCRARRESLWESLHTVGVTR